GRRPSARALRLPGLRGRRIGVFARAPERRRRRVRGVIPKPRWLTHEAVCKARRAADGRADGWADPLVTGAKTADFARPADLDQQPAPSTAAEPLAIRASLPPSLKSRTRPRLRRHDRLYLFCATM